MRLAKIEGWGTGKSPLPAGWKACSTSRRGPPPLIVGRGSGMAFLKMQGLGYCSCKYSVLTQGNKRNEASLTSFPYVRSNVAEQRRPKEGVMKKLCVGLLGLLLSGLGFAAPVVRGPGAIVLPPQGIVAPPPGVALPPGQPVMPPPIFLPPSGVPLPPPNVGLPSFATPLPPGVALPANEVPLPPAGVPLPPPTLQNPSGSIALPSFATPRTR